MISQLLSNVYLHYVLDEWFSEQIQPLLKGKSFIVRYADDFILGFTHFLSKSRKGIPVLKRKTSSKGLTRTIMNVSDYTKRNRHMKLNKLIAILNVKLRGHYNYYGVTFNSRSLYGFFWQ